MKKTKDIREKILEKVREYYFELKKETDQRFEPGEMDIRYSGRVFDAEEMVNLVDSSLDFWLTYGRYSKKFERRLSKFLGVKTTLTVNSGSSANLLAFMALTSPLLKDRMVRRGDEVITVAACFPTTIAPIIQYGAIPVFVDIELDTLNIDVVKLQQAITPRTKAVMLAHTLGNPFDVKTVKDFCDQNGLWLIEDNCDALGSRFDGQFTGTAGDCGTSSFYPPHHITTGEGGAVYTSDPLLSRIMLSMRDWGRDCWCDSGVDNTCKKRFERQFGSLPFGYDHKYVYGHFGYNLKMTEMQASIGCAQLEKLPTFVEQRKRNFQILFEGLKDQDVLSLPRSLPEADPSWFGFFITLQNGVPFSRSQLVCHLESSRIQTRNLFAGNIVRHPCFGNLVENEDYRVVGRLANTDKVMHDGFWIGLYPGMDRAQLQYMIDKIVEFLTDNK